MRLSLLLLPALSLIPGCLQPSRAATPPSTPPALVMGGFEDDYGNSFRLSSRLFEQLPGNRFHIVEWNVSEQFFIARNDSANSSDQGLWTRVDWMPFAGMTPFTWGFCITAYRAPSRDAARATPPANRAIPRSGCNGYPFSRMKRVRRLPASWGGSSAG